METVETKTWHKERSQPFGNLVCCSSLHSWKSIWQLLSICQNTWKSFPKMVLLFTVSRIFVDLTKVLILFHFHYVIHKILLLCNFTNWKCMKVLKGVHFQGSLEWQSLLITNNMVYNQILWFFFSLGNCTQGYRSARYEIQTIILIVLILLTMPTLPIVFSTTKKISWISPNFTF